LFAPCPDHFLPLRELSPLAKTCFFFAVFLLLDPFVKYGYLFLRFLTARRIGPVFFWMGTALPTTIPLSQYPPSDLPTPPLLSPPLCRPFVLCFSTLRGPPFFAQALCFWRTTNRPFPFSLSVSEPPRFFGRISQRDAHSSGGLFILFGPWLFLTPVAILYPRSPCFLRLSRVSALLRASPLVSPQLFCPLCGPIPPYYF